MHHDTPLPSHLPTCLQAIEYQVQQGLAGALKEDLWLMPASRPLPESKLEEQEEEKQAATGGSRQHGPELFGNSVVLRLLTQPGDQHWGLDPVKM
jgi:hypothetical protein